MRFWFCYTGERFIFNHLFWYGNVHSNSGSKSWSRNLSLSKICCRKGRSNQLSSITLLFKCRRYLGFSWRSMVKLIFLYICNRKSYKNTKYIHLFLRLCSLKRTNLKNCILVLFWHKTFFLSSLKPILYLVFYISSLISWLFCCLNCII